MAAEKFPIEAGHIMLFGFHVQTPDNVTFAII